jgi:hypothetical protein
VRCHGFETRRAGCPVIKPASSFSDVILHVQASLIKLAGVSTTVSTLLAAGNAQAAQEVAALAARDNRASTLLLLLAPALGWVAFNILAPALNQLKGMQNAKRSAAIGLGLSAAALLSAQNADAAEEIAQVRCVADCITSDAADWIGRVLIPCCFCSWLLAEITGCSSLPLCLCLLLAGSASTSLGLLLTSFRLRYKRM